MTEICLKINKKEEKFETYRKKIVSKCRKIVIRIKNDYIFFKTHATTRPIYDSAKLDIEAHEANK